MNKALFAVIAVIIIIAAGFVGCVKNDSDPEEGFEGLGFTEPMHLEAVPVVQDFGSASSSGGGGSAAAVLVPDSGGDVEDGQSSLIPGQDVEEFEDDGLWSEAISKSFQAIGASLVIEGFDVFPAYIMRGPSRVNGLAFETEEVFESDEGDTCYGVVFITAEPVGIQYTEVFPSDDVHEGRYLWTGTMDMERIQYIVGNRYCNASVDESRLSVRSVSLGEDKSSRSYSVELKKAYDPDSPLYDYDTGAWVVAPRVSKSISWEPLYRNLDFAEIKSDMERLIKSQEDHFLTEEFETLAEASIEAIKAYLAESNGRINNISIPELDDYRKGLSWREVLVVDGDGYSAMYLEDPPASELERWLCGALFAAVALFSVAAIVALPVMGVAVNMAVVGAISGAALGFTGELFNQVSLNGTSFSNVDWKRPFISAAIGAATGPWLGKVSGIVASSVSAFVETGLFALMDGEGIGSALVSAAFASTIGLLIGGGMAEAVKIT
ncbi:MAG: hypothetical protein J5674_00450, partial [Candidatus Methanomethylophilaceae archaeon]|nr:hypothetical protein [Candidatus Methanomethylophilaceae archaeon]